ncbi:MAG: hypothetical protein ACI84K_001400 [Pseudohongiellaceae bacterium]|jgi:hypothetical protein
MSKIISAFNSVPFIKVVILLVSCGVVLADEEYESSADLHVELAREETRDNLKHLLGVVIEKTSVLQATYGDFSPYGAALFKDGSIKYVWYAKPGQIVKEPAKSIPLIRGALQSQALSGKIVGSAVVYKVKQTEQGLPQLNVELEYQTGLALAYASEITVDANNNTVWGENTQVNFEPRVFVLRDGQALPEELSVIQE